MPVAFLLGEGGPNHPKEITNKDDTVVQAGTYQLLNEIAVVGFLACENRGLTGVSNN
ncbi:hypothetical protein BN8_01625 [Fibrisoma limi BUZ 3]|uniref:Uncharacterized protein n=1 Tax=Fibrisoma limi BUZ 3 TaxID=1185876 RepID=I2GFD7_9BACT|nr:hypothetical protein BN8_01625 [Fibrisoma limi BUZ 3]